MEDEMCNEIDIPAKMGQRWYTELHEIVKTYSRGSVFVSDAGLDTYLACWHSLQMMESRGWKID